MGRHSAGILLYRVTDGVVEVLLVHPGGPFWAKKDDAAWSIPKGEFDPATADPLDAAVREFTEETGFDPPDAPAFLAELTQLDGKIVHARTARGDVDCRDLRSNTFEIQWPPGSGKRRRSGRSIVPRGSTPAPPGGSCTRGRCGWWVCSWRSWARRRRAKGVRVRAWERKRCDLNSAGAKALAARFRLGRPRLSWAALTARVYRSGPCPPQVVPLYALGGFYAYGSALTRACRRG